jgi:effector-binding domain-containing protein
MRKVIYALGLVIIVCSCKNGSDTKETTVQKDSVAVVDSSMSNTTIDIPTTAGVIGIFEIPEMLTLCKKDSAKGKDISFTLAKTYSALEEDMKACGAELSGAPGALYYTNTPENFVFEGVLPIKRMPTKMPEHCNIVVLEKSKMLVYNYYGPYEKMFDAYAQLKTYLEKNKLEQTGVAREFYITDPMLEKDVAKWLSRIFIPVK